MVQRYIDKNTSIKMGLISIQQQNNDFLTFFF